MAGFQLKIEELNKEHEAVKLEYNLKINEKERFIETMSIIHFDFVASSILEKTESLAELKNKLAEEREKVIIFNFNL